jgi:endo-1,4-beta-D-glucanase Y
MRLVALLLLLVADTAAAQFPSRAFPYGPLNYGAQLIRPDHRTSAQMNQDVKLAYQRWKARYLIAVSPGVYRIDGGYGNGVFTRSDAQGYGMLIVALMAGGDGEPQAHPILQGLLSYAQTHPSGNDNRLMTWKTTSGGLAVDGNHSLFAGDADIALALLIAQMQFDADVPGFYLPHAQSRIAAQAASVMGADSALPLLGDWVDPTGATYNQYTVRVADFLPAHFVNFARAGGQPIWTRAIAAGSVQIEHLQTTHAPATGLVPDFAVRESTGDRLRPAPANFYESAEDGDYSFNASRVPWRIGVHAVLYGDAASLRQARRFAQWSEAAAGGNPAQLYSGYRLDGTPLRTSFWSVFAASAAVATMTSPNQQSWLNALYDSIRTREQGYFDDDSVALLALLILSGNYWEPAAPLDRLFLGVFD